MAADEIAASEIASHLVSLLYRLIDDELVTIYLDALRRLGPALSPCGWRRGDGEGS